MENNNVLSRKPLSRMQITNDLAETVLQRPVQTSELLMTNVPPEEGLFISHIQNIFSGKIPLRTETIATWPDCLNYVQCLHCGGFCTSGPPVPVARHYEAQLDRYWVYGPFCRPCCAFGYICETDSTSKQLAPTAELMRRFFGVSKIIVAPPRAAHQRFGGPLSDYDFYGLSGYNCLRTIQPPFVTFANYVVGVHQSTSNGTRIESSTALLPQSAGRLINLERPTDRSFPIAEKKQTGKPPMILEFLATLKSSKDVQDSSESIDLKDTKKRRVTNEPRETTNFLKQFIKAKAS